MIYREENTLSFICFILSLVKLGPFYVRRHFVLMLIHEPLGCTSFLVHKGFSLACPSVVETFVQACRNCNCFCTLDIHYAQQVCFEIKQRANRVMSALVVFFFTN
jgi:hypothetical protein